MADAPELENLNLLNYGSEPDLVNAAVEYMQASLPQWQPRVGSPELVLIESLALILGVDAVAIQMLSGQIVEQLMAVYGVTRDQGRAATGRVTFTVTNSAPIQTIPAGTRLRFILESTGETVELITIDQLDIITTDTLTGSVDVVSESTGAASNGTIAGTPVDLVDSLPFIETAVLAQNMVGGAEVESDNAFYARAAATLSRLTSVLVGPDTFQYAALSQPGVGRAKVFDRYNPAAPDTTATGHVTVAVADADGLVLSPTVMSDLETWLSSQALASIFVHVIEPTYTTVNLAITVRAVPGYTEAMVQTSVESVVRALVNSASWDWTPAVTQYQLIAAISSAAGVRSITTVPADVALAGKAPLPVLGTLDITVTA